MSNPIVYQTYSGSGDQIVVNDVLELKPFGLDEVNFSTEGEAAKPSNYAYRPAAKQQIITLKNCAALTNAQTIELYIDRFVQFDKAGLVCAKLGAEDTLQFFLMNTEDNDYTTPKTWTVASLGRYLKLTHPVDDEILGALDELTGNIEIMLDGESGFSISVEAGENDGKIARRQTKAVNNIWRVSPPMNGGVAL